MTETKPTLLSIKRPWYRYNLRVLLIFAVVVGIGTCWFAVKKWQVSQQREAMLTIGRCGGWVMLDNECDDKGFPRTQRPTTVMDSLFDTGLPIVAGEPAGPTWLRRLVGNGFFSRAKSARIENDAGMECLTKLPELECLFLSGSHITADGLKHLGGLTHLRWLDLQCTQTTDDDLESIKELKHLEGLYLGGTCITDAGMSHVAGLFKLRDLSLSETPITDAGVEHIKELAGLQVLHLQGTHLTNKGVIFLKGLPQLYELNLSHTQMSDAGLEHLEGLTHLKSLNLENTKVTIAGVKMLQEALPGCVILYSTL